MSPHSVLGFAARSALWISTLLALLLPAAPVRATVVTELGFESLVSSSDLIVDGSVVSIVSRWADDRHTIYTFVKIAVHELVRGHLEDPAEVTLRFEGGEVDGVQLITAALPTFRPGERDLFFVHGNGRAISPLVGFFQGRFRVLGGRVYDHSGSAILGVRDGMLVQPPPPAVAGAETAGEGTASAGEPVEGPYFFGPAPVAPDHESLAEPPHSLPEESPALSRESPAGTSLVRPAPEAVSRAAAPPPRPVSAAAAPGEAMSVAAMIQEIRKVIRGGGQS